MFFGYWIEYQVSRKAIVFKGKFDEEWTKRLIEWYWNRGFSETYLFRFILTFMCNIPFSPCIKKLSTYHRRVPWPTFKDRSSENFLMAALTQRGVRERWHNLTACAASVYMSCFRILCYEQEQHYLPSTEICISVYKSPLTIRTVVTSYFQVAF